MHRISLAKTDQRMDTLKGEMQRLSHKRFRRATPATELQHESRIYVVSELRRSASVSFPGSFSHAEPRTSRYMHTFVEDMWIFFPLNMSVIDDAVLDNFVHGGENESIPLYVNLLTGLFSGTSGFFLNRS